MDSCHIFNFLFGTKKATTELSKCFSNLTNAAQRKSRSRTKTYSDDSNIHPQNNSNTDKCDCSSSGASLDVEHKKNCHRQSTRASSCSATINHKSNTRDPPPSPLKQLQMKLTRLAPAFYAKHKQQQQSYGKYEPQSPCKDAEDLNCDGNCGTYRATLVELVEDSSELVTASTMIYPLEEDYPTEDVLASDKKDINAFNDKGGSAAASYSTTKSSSIANDKFGEAGTNNSNASISLLVDDRNQTTIHHNNDIDEFIASKEYDPRRKGNELSNSTDMSSTLLNPLKSVVVTSKSGNTYTSSLISANAMMNIVDENNNNQLSPDDVAAAAAASSSLSRTNLPKRVVMYDDQDIGHETERDKVVASSAQVYKLFSEYGDARAKLRRVSSVSIDGEVKIHSIDDEETEILDENNNSNLCKNEMNTSPITQRNYPMPDQSLLQEKRNVYVRNLVSSFENGSFDCDKKDHQTKNNNIQQQQYGFAKPVSLVKPLPPSPPPKHIIRGATSRKNSQCISYQIRLNKPLKIEDLFQDEEFLKRYFFDKLEPLDRCVSAQVCRTWRNVLYSNQNYWKDLVNVIDYTQLRREHLVECIMNTIQSAKLRHQQQQLKSSESSKERSIHQEDSLIFEQVQQQKQSFVETYFNFDLDHDDIWKIQELCNKFTANHHRIHSQSSRQHMINSDSNEQTNYNSPNNIINNNNNHNCIANSKSSSIPSQISSTLSSVSISSLLSPLSESSRIDSIREKLYTSLDNRGFDVLCLFGASDEDVEDLVYKIPSSAHKRITVSRLNNCSFTDRGLELLITTFYNLEELELSGCNEITNALEFKDLLELKRLIITDCINIADGIAPNLILISHQLSDLTIQAYHLTDAFLEYLCTNSDTSRLTRLELPNCKEITNHTLVTVAKYLPQLEVLSVSGSTKITDEGIEVLVEHTKRLKSLDLSWCTRITDASLECIACDLQDTLTDLILDRNIHITDVGLECLATMRNLTLLHIRWCLGITDVGLECLWSMRSLEYLSLAGIHQITARSLLCFVETNLVEIELTNCPAVNNELVMFLSAQMPRCNIIF